MEQESGYPLFFTSLSFNFYSIYHYAYFYITYHLICLVNIWPQNTGEYLLTFLWKFQLSNFKVHLRISVAAYPSTITLSLCPIVYQI